MWNARVRFKETNLVPLSISFNIYFDAFKITKYCNRMSKCDFIRFILHVRTHLFTFHRRSFYNNILLCVQGRKKENKRQSLPLCWAKKSIVYSCRPWEEGDRTIWCHVFCCFWSKIWIHACWMGIFLLAAIDDEIHYSNYHY